MIFGARIVPHNGPLSVCHAFSHPYITKISEFEALTCLGTTFIFRCSREPGEPSFTTWLRGARAWKLLHFAHANPLIYLLDTPCALKRCSFATANGLSHDCFPGAPARYPCCPPSQSCETPQPHPRQRGKEKIWVTKMIAMSGCSVGVQCRGAQKYTNPRKLL